MPKPDITNEEFQRMTRDLGPNFDAITDSFITAETAPLTTDEMQNIWCLSRLAHLILDETETSRSLEGEARAEGETLLLGHLMHIDCAAEAVERLGEEISQQMLRDPMSLREITAAALERNCDCWNNNGTSETSENNDSHSLLGGLQASSERLATAAAALCVATGIASLTGDADALKACAPACEAHARHISYVAASLSLRNNLKSEQAGIDIDELRSDTASAAMECMFA